MYDQPDKSRFNLSIPKIALVCYVITFLIIVLFIEVNRDVFLQTLELMKPPSIPLIILNDLPTWARFGVYFIGGLVQVLVGAFCLLLIRYFLPQKYRRYLTWRNVK